MFKKSKILKAIRVDLLKGIRLHKAIENAGLRSRQTLENWRNKRPMIDRYILKCMGWGEEERIDLVEDAHLKRLLKGNASAADYEFYLTRRRPKRWPKREAFNNNINVTTKVNSDNRSVHLEQCSSDEIRKVIALARQAQ